MQPPTQTWLVSATHPSVNASLKTRQAEVLSPPPRTLQHRSICTLGSLKENSNIDVNDRYARCLLLREAGSRRQDAPPGVSPPRALKTSGEVSLVANADLTKQMTIRAKARTVESLELTGAPAPTATTRRGEAPAGSEIPAIPLNPPQAGSDDTAPRFGPLGAARLRASRTSAIPWGFLLLLQFAAAAAATSPLRAGSSVTKSPRPGASRTQQPTPGPLPGSACSSDALPAVTAWRRLQLPRGRSAYRTEHCAGRTASSCDREGLRRHGSVSGVPYRPEWKWIESTRPRDPSA